MRRSLLLLPLAAIVVLSGCVIAPPAIQDPDPQPSPDVSTQPSPDVSTQPSPSPTQQQTAEAPEPNDNLGPITAGGEEGSTGNPFPPGADLTGGEWSLVVSAANLDAEATVVAGGGLPAPDGWRWISTDVRVSTTGAESSTGDVWASYVAPDGDVFFSVIDSSIPGSNQVEDMVAGQEYAFTEFLLAPEATLEQGVLSITTAGLTSFIRLQ